MTETIIAAIVAFIGTNIDDIFINTLFFTQTQKKDDGKIVLGKYFGIGTLVLLSLLGASGLQLIPRQHIGLLGIVPIALGIKEWLSYLRKKDSDDTSDKEITPQTKGLVFHVAAVTIANGADNLGVYIPLFMGYSALQMIIVAIVFTVMTALWCVLGKKLSDLPFLQKFLTKRKHIIVPLVFVMLGVYILFKSYIL